MSFGRLQPQHDRAVRHGEFRVELFFFALGVGDLPCQDFHLPLAGVESIGGSVFGEILEDPTECRSANAQERHQPAVLSEG